MPENKDYIAPGTVVNGKYRVLRPIDSGGMGVVYNLGFGCVEGKRWLERRNPPETLNLVFAEPRNS